MTCILNIVNSASLISWEPLWRWKILVFELIPLRMTVCDVYHHPIVTETYACLRSTKIIISFPDHRNIPQNLKKKSVTYHLKITQVYPNRISKISSKHSKTSLTPALNWAWHRGPSGGLQADAAHANRTLWRRRKRKIQKGQGKMTYTWWAPERAKLVTINLMKTVWIYEVYSQWDLRVYIIVSVVLATSCWVYWLLF